MFQDGEEIEMAEWLLHASILLKVNISNIIHSNISYLKIMVFFASEHAVNII